MIVVLINERLWLLKDDWSFREKETLVDLIVGVILFLEER